LSIDGAIAEADFPLHIATVRFKAVEGTGVDRIIGELLQHAGTFQKLPDAAESAQFIPARFNFFDGGAAQSHYVQETEADGIIFNDTAAIYTSAGRCGRAR
jgi:hypothetical protein